MPPKEQSRINIMEILNSILPHAKKALSMAQKANDNVEQTVKSSDVFSHHYGHILEGLTLIKENLKQ